MGSARPTPSEQACGPAVPTPSGRAVHRPLGIRDVALTGGPLGRWQQVNRDASIPLGIKQLGEAGNLDNLRLAAQSVAGELGEDAAAAFRGPRFSDSDVYKQLEAVAWEAGRAPDDDLMDFVRQAGELLLAAQRADGYLNSYYQVVAPEKEYAELAHSHEMYCAGHLIQAAVAIARVGGGEQVRTVATRFADHLVKVFLHDGNPGIDGHPEIETALVELYRVTGERSYLTLAEKLVNERGKGLISGRGRRYLQDHLPVREADTHVGHAVRALYLEAGIVDVYLETGDESLLECSVRRWNDMVAAKTYLTGGVGSRHAQEAFGDRYELPPDRAYTETCAAIASIHWSWRLLLATGEGRYADLIERTLYNGFAASTSTDGTRFFYVNPLQRRHDHFEGDDPGRRNEWFSCACCPPNIMRLVATLGHYVASVSEPADGLFVHQFVPGTIRAELPSGAVGVSVATDFPWAGTVSFTIDQAPGSEWTLAVRAPVWSTAVSIAVDGQPMDVAPDESGYLRLRRAWKPGEQVTLELDMTPRIVYPHHRMDAVRGTAAVERGPLVYCVEQADQSAGADVDDLALVPGTEPRVVDVDDLAGVGRTVTLHLDAVVVSPPGNGSPGSATPPYSTTPPEEQVTTTPTTAVAIPYFQWDNRDGAAMRVWLPVAHRSSP
ncbi:beta-L-arabinofuranosidase domain-containing protein [Actinopolymorpha sp. B11F2]|uniref:glycoside hydrolase family 127 protein n=1 Tax=Actinopolymorpha sp. B11F2 TaxID=3160862 RepID=UPI0032E3F87C